LDHCDHVGPALYEKSNYSNATRNNKMSNKLTTQPEIPPPGGQILLYSEGQTNINVRIEGETVWLTQAAMAELFQTTPQKHNYPYQKHLRRGRTRRNANL
jgi:hypothetical protein